jgi:putative oxidoreductase
MNAIRGAVMLLGRVLLSLIFLMSAVGNDIPNFHETAAMTGSKGVPFPEVALGGAIVFLIVGSVSVIVGWYARFGAALLAIFLVLATYFFHNFWAISDPAMAKQQMLEFMKNLALFGATLTLIANGAGPWSVDDCCGTKAPSEVSRTA